MANLPSGSVISIRNTSELKIGDYVIIEGLGILARGYLGVSDPAILKVFAFDIRPDKGINKVGVKTPKGADLWFDGGTYNELVSKLSQKASFTKLYVIRPEAPRPAMVEAEKSYALDELEKVAVDLGLPKGMSRMGISSFADLKLGDFLSSISPNETRRLWKVTDDSGSHWTIRLVGTSLTRTEGPGEEVNLLKNDPYDPGNTAVFRKMTELVPVHSNGAVVPGAPVGIRAAQAPSIKGILFGGAALAGIAGLIWYLNKRRRDEEED